MRASERDELRHPVDGRQAVELLLGVTLVHQDVHHGTEFDHIGLFDLPKKLS